MKHAFFLFSTLLMLSLALFAKADSVVEASEDDDALLLIHKTLDADYVVVNKPVQVTINLFNIGSKKASDVHCEDSTFKEAGPKFELLDGDYSAVFDSVMPKSNVSYTYTVVAKDNEGVYNNQFVNAPAKITYYRESGLSQNATSSSQILVRIISEQEYLAKFAPHQHNWIIYFALNAFLVGGPYALHMMAEKALSQE